MLEAMPVQKLAVAGRAVVRILPQPIYDTECAKAATATSEWNFYQNGVGKADNSAIIAAKGYSHTNLQGGNGQLGKPYEFDLYSFNVKVHAITSAYLLVANFNALYNDGFCEFKLGNRIYLQVPMKDMPTGVGMVQMGTTTADITNFFANGVQHRSNAWKYTVGKYLVHIRSNEPFSFRIAYTAAVTASVSTYIQVYMNGLLYNAI